MRELNLKQLARRCMKELLLLVTEVEHLQTDEMWLRGAMISTHPPTKRRHCGDVLVDNRNKHLRK
jgi:hypothetical protein